jgi:hypothetical protein
MGILIIPLVENVSRETFSVVSQKISFSPDMPNLAQSVSRETSASRRTRF